MFFFKFFFLKKNGIKMFKMRVGAHLVYSMDNVDIKEISDLIDTLRLAEKDLNIESFNETEKKVYWTILSTVHKNGHCNISDIINNSSLSRSTVYKTITKFDSENLLDIEQSELDKREFNIILNLNNT